MDANLLMCLFSYNKPTLSEFYYKKKKMHDQKWKPICGFDLAERCIQGIIIFIQSPNN